MGGSVVDLLRTIRCGHICAADATMGRLHGTAQGRRGFPSPPGCVIELSEVLAFGAHDARIPRWCADVTVGPARPRCGVESSLKGVLVDVGAVARILLSGPPEERDAQPAASNVAATGPHRRHDLRASISTSLTLELSVASRARVIFPVLPLRAPRTRFPGGVSMQGQGQDNVKRRGCPVPPSGHMLTAYITRQIHGSLCSTSGGRRGGWPWRYPAAVC